MCLVQTGKVPHKISTATNVKHIQEPAASKHQQAFRREDLKNKEQCA